MYCESEAARLRYKDLLKKEEAATEEEKDRTTRTKKFLLEHINNAKGYTDEDIAHFQEESRFSLEEKAIMEACSLNNSFNAPMLVSWLTKHFNEEVVMIKGLEFLSKHLETVEGCVLMEKHNVIEVLLKIQAFFKSNPPMQLLVLPAIRRLLDCNYTRGKIIKDTKVLKSVFSIAHLYMNSKSHIDLAARCIMQCSRSEVNRSEIIKLNVINYLLTFSGRFAKNSSILRSILRLLLWVSNTQERLEIVCQLKGVHVALRCMKKHTSNRDVMGPAIAFLARAAAAYPPAMATILYKNGMPDIVNAMKLVYDDEVIQIEAIKLIQLLTKTSEGWKQLSELKGGWQLVCQGTTLGDALVHEQPGGLHNPGWAIGEMPFLPLLERRKLDAAKYAKSSIDPEPKTSWTASSLREFMGLSMAGLTLAINREYHDTYFDLLSTLDLLPKESTSTEEAEEREAWFHRLKVFESENMVKIDDMVNTVLAMKRREEATKKSTKYDSVAGPSEAVKELYVMGSQITSQTLTQTDIDIADRLAGIMN